MHLTVGSLPVAESIQCGPNKMVGGGTFNHIRL